jgi:diketogulonate reductase-like aldo/keto reductase
MRIDMKQAKGFDDVVDAHGARIPRVGLGTYQLNGAKGQAAMEAGLAAGYRALDTAAMYENEAEVGAALRASGMARGEIFVTTKVWTTEWRREAFLRSAEASLSRLKLDHVDLLLVHWPDREMVLEETIGALNEAMTRGLASHIGVSNFPPRLFRAASALSAAPLAALQCEYHPELDQSATLAACRAAGAAFISYSPLGKGQTLAHPTIGEIARRLGRTPAQIILRWHLQQPGVAAIPRSQSAERIESNLHGFDFILSDDDMARISAMARPDGRKISPAWGPDWNDA